MVVVSLKSIQRSRILEILKGITFPNDTQYIIYIGSKVQTFIQEAHKEHKIIQYIDFTQ